MGAIVIVDAFYGDAGKGKFCAYLSKQLDIPLAVRAGTGTNAGHSIYIEKQLIKCRMLPLGWINPSTKILISSGVAVNPVLFLEEVEKYKLYNRAFIDWRCPIIENSHIEYENNDNKMEIIDSTKSGTGKCRAEFIMRNAKQAKDIIELKEYTIDGIKMANNTAQKSDIIIEGSQATFLSLYASDRYPYVTSDNCTTAAFIDDVSLNWQYIERVLLLVKCLPTCVGNGYLPYEMSKEEIIANKLEEYGINTGRFKRRSSQIDYNRLLYAVEINGATEIALTYCDQYDSSIKYAMDKSKISKKIIELINKIEKETHLPVKYLETGINFENIIDLEK